MDSKRRHELSQNYLANWLITQYEDSIRPNAQLIGWGAIVLLVLLLLFWGSMKIRQWNREAAWQQYYSAVTSTDAPFALETLADSSEGDLGVRARLNLAQLLLGDACNGIFEDKTKAVEDLEKAIRHFQIVLQRASNDDYKREAAWGLGQAYETMAAFRSGSDDLGSAAKEYKALAERWPNEILGRRASKQAALITRPETKKFFELAAAKASEPPKEEEFKVDIDTKDPFQGGPGAFDPQKALGKTSILGGEFNEPVVKLNKPEETTNKPEETTSQEKREEVPEKAESSSKDEEK